MKYEAYFKKHIGVIEKALREMFEKCEMRPRAIHRAMQYAVFTGGKRFRPVLALVTCEACGGKMHEAVLPACSLELIHTYSLVHDDLPALDNDDTRRGKPTCHKKFGEATAILAGDALLTLAFEILAGMRPSEKVVKLLREISTAAGVRGMIGGQVEDIETVRKRLDRKTHDFICAHKTGKLITASVLSGAIAVGASQKQMAAAKRYGESMGLAFQVVDDILDHDGYCRFMTTDQTVRKAKMLIARSRNEARKIGSRNAGLLYLADFLESRIPV